MDWTNLLFVVVLEAVVDIKHDCTLLGTLLLYKEKKRIILRIREYRIKENTPINTTEKHLRMLVVSIQFTKKKSSLSHLLQQ
jgi:hypothetical protein